jgi:hypothetical protein
MANLSIFRGLNADYVQWTKVSWRRSPTGTTWAIKVKWNERKWADSFVMLHKLTLVYNPFPNMHSQAVTAGTVVGMHWKGYTDLCKGTVLAQRTDADAKDDVECVSTHSNDKVLLMKKTSLPSSHKETTKTVTKTTSKSKVVTTTPQSPTDTNFPRLCGSCGLCSCKCQCRVLPVSTPNDDDNSDVECDSAVL